MKEIYKTACIIIALSLIVAILGCAGSREKDPTLQMRVQRVQATLTDISEALERYKDERGYFPKGMATLRDAQYLSIMPDLEREWTFKYYTDGGRVMMVEAVSTSNMPDGAGYKIVFRVPDQTWDGYGITVWP